ncbi:MAG: SH3 domain-containing protein [bacterium]
MTKKLFIFLLSLIMGISIYGGAVLAYGDGYTDCERDAIYERNNKGYPTTGLFLRSRACMTGSEILKTLPANVEVNIIAETDGWFKVKDSAGAIGWVGARLMHETSNSTVNNTLGSEHFLLNINSGSSNEEKQKVTERVLGYILLQVESHGEAWYVDPVSAKRYYMKDGSAAYQIMRNFGLGINNDNLEKLKNGDSSLANRLRGRIVLQVEAHGEAYYIHPKDGKAHYLANGDEAYRIMRELSLGITNSDLEKISLQ